MIHTNSFKSIGGFNEEFTEYGPEDAEFNTRISVINTYIEETSVLSIHMHHPYTGFLHGINMRPNLVKNIERYEKLLEKLEVCNPEEKQVLITNNNPWGIIE